MLDEGLSAYHQRHVTSGALGAFLAGVQAGRIEAGSVLVVEGLDRLSRAEPIQAQAQLAQIVNAGITVVTASDGKVCSRERLKANPMDLVYSLLLMIRAHEESDTKGKRGKACTRGRTPSSQSVASDVATDAVERGTPWRWAASPLISPFSGSPRPYSWVGAKLDDVFTCPLCR